TGLVSNSTVARREFVSAIYDSRRDRIVAYGGMVHEVPLNDVWQLTLEATPAWTPLATVGTRPVARPFHRAAYDPVHDLMLLYQATDDTYLSGEVWALSLGDLQWSLVASYLPNSLRPSAIWDPVRERLIFCTGDASTGG